MAIVDADYSAVVEDCRGHISHGTQPDGADTKKVIALVQDAVARMTTNPATAQTATAAALALIQTQMTALAAFDTDVEVIAGTAAAAAAVALAISTWDTQKALIEAAIVPATVPTLIVSPNADG